MYQVSKAMEGLLGVCTVNSLEDAEFLLQKHMKRHRESPPLKEIFQRHNMRAVTPQSVRALLRSHLMLQCHPVSRQERARIQWDVTNLFRKSRAMVLPHGCQLGPTMSTQLQTYAQILKRQLLLDIRQIQYAEPTQNITFPLVYVLPWMWHNPHHPQILFKDNMLWVHASVNKHLPNPYPCPRPPSEWIPISSARLQQDILLLTES